MYSDKLVWLPGRWRLACDCMGRDKFAPKFYFCLKHNRNLFPAVVRRLSQFSVNLLMRVWPSYLRSVSGIRYSCWRFHCNSSLGFMIWFLFKDNVHLVFFFSNYRSHYVMFLHTVISIHILKVCIYIYIYTHIKHTHMQSNSATSSWKGLTS